MWWHGTDNEFRFGEFGMLTIIAQFFEIQTYFTFFCKLKYDESHAVRFGPFFDHFYAVIVRFVAFISIVS